MSGGPVYGRLRVPAACGPKLAKPFAFSTFTVVNENTVSREPVGGDVSGFLSAAKQRMVLQFTFAPGQAFLAAFPLLLRPTLCLRPVLLFCLAASSEAFAA
jgi:hypothetical protein